MSAAPETRSKALITPAPTHFKNTIYTAQPESLFVVSIFVFRPLFAGDGGQNSSQVQSEANPRESISILMFNFTDSDP